MANILYCEFLKLKRSKMFLISILGGMVAPIMVFAGLIKARISKPEMIITYKDLFDQTSLYVLLLFGLIVYGVIAAYLFSREYTENTLKSIITIPVSKTSFILGKFLMLFIWIILLTLVGWVGTLLLGVLGRAEEFSFTILLISLRQYVVGASLLYLTMSPFVFITLWVKNLVPPIIAVAAVALGNVALSNEDLAVLFPWSSGYLIAMDLIGNFSYGIGIAITIILITFVVGFAASILYFKKQDIK